MTKATPAEMQRLLAAEFDRLGWEYDLTVGREVLATMEAGRSVDGRKVADSISATFFDRNGTTRADVGAAIDRALGTRSLEPEHVPITLVISDNRYQLNVGAGAQVVESNINVGTGTQVIVDVDAPKGEVLAALEAIVRSALAGAWNLQAAQALEVVIDKRGDVTVDEVRDVTSGVVRKEQPKRERVKELLREIATGGLAGALGTGISFGLGELITHLPM